MDIEEDKVPNLPVAQEKGSPASDWDCLMVMLPNGEQLAIGYRNGVMRVRSPKLVPVEVDFNSTGAARVDNARNRFIEIAMRVDNIPEY